MIKKKAFAKLNLNLHILPKKNNDEYHHVHFVNSQLSLYDELIFEPISSEIKVICDYEGMPRQEDNLVYKAALLLQKMAPQKPGIKITIKKNIPIRAGLGGGSSDAGTTVNTLSKLWGIALTDNQKNQIADVLGNDVHYFLAGGLAEVSANGDEINKLPFKVPQFWVAIIVPNETKSSTRQMYKQIDENKIGKHVSFVENIKKSMKENNKTKLLNNIFNDFENTVFKNFPVTLEMKKDLENNGALKILLCGSGLSMAGFFEDKIDAINIQQKLKNKYKQIIVTKFN